MSKVAIIGTGPSGLAAAKALAEHGIAPTVFESALNIGGMWAGEGRGAWSSDMRTNLSHHSCAFSDFPWSSGTDLFPLRREVIHYLTAYAAEFSLLQHIHFGVRVTAIRRDAGNTWRLDMVHNGVPESAVFDHVIMTTGFFSIPYTPDFPGLETFRGKILHAAQTDSPAAHREDLAGKRVLIIGAAFSGTEIAGRLAATAAEVTVTMRRPMWFVPRMIAARPGGRLYPYDLVFYDRSPDNRLLRQPHLFLTEIGGDPGAISPDLAFPPGVDPSLDMVITDDFLPLIAARRIAVKRTSTLQFDETGVIFADRTRRDIDTAVMCTGYTTALPLFDAATLAAIEFDPADRLQPTLLHEGVFHPELPGLAFVGHYRGPYFPIMELQSRWIARIAAGEIPAPSEAEMREGVEAERRIRLANPRPQFPHGDFVGLADHLAHNAGVQPALAPDSPMQPYLARGPVISAHFRLSGPHAKPVLATATIRATPAPRLDPDIATIAPSAAPKSASAARVMNLLNGRWSIDRTVEPGGTFAGTASFTSRPDGSLFYEESGTLRLPNGTEMTGGNRYLYTLRENAIDISFADGSSAGTHFVNIAFPENGALQSADRHQCRLDQYDAIFNLENDNRYTMTYVVCGPRKGYVSRSTYTRLA